MTNPVRLRFSDDKTLLYAMIRPQDVVSGKLAPENILEALLEVGYSSFQFELDQNAFDDLIQLHWQHLNHEIVKCLARRIEFDLQVQISEDQMQAWATIQPAFSGEVIDPERLLEKLAYMGVKQGYLPEALEQILTEGQAEQLLVAVGRWPVNGQNAWLEPLFQRTSTEIPSALVVQLEPGVPLAQMHPATVGQDGFTVTGRVLPAQPGKNLQLVPSVGSDFSPVNSQILVSQQSGCPIVRFNSVRLDPILTLEQADSQTGVLNYPGSVLILGAVQAGGLVKSRGHIEILGDVHAAQLEAGGDILVHGKIDGQSLIRSGGHLSAAALSQVFVESQRDIRIREEVYQSHLRAGGSIWVGDSSETGRIVGGRLIALKQVQVAQIGNQRKSEVQVHLGCDDYFCDQLEAKKFALTEACQELDDTLKKLIQARSQGQSQLNLELLQRKLLSIEYQVEQLRDELFFLEQRIRIWPYGQGLVLKKALSAVLKISMGSCMATFSEPMQGAFSFCLRQVGEQAEIRAIPELPALPGDEAALPELRRAESPHIQPHSAIP